MKLIAVSVLMLACSGAWAQTTTSGSESGSSSTATGVGVGGTNSNVVSNTGSSQAGANSVSSSGANSSLNGQITGATGGNASSSANNHVSNNQGQNQKQAQDQVNGQTVNFNSTSADSVKTVGTPGAVSYGVSFSQFNCANTAAVGGGWLGGVLQLGGPLESGPCNARANAAALFQMSQALATSDPTKSAQLFNAAVLLIGNSTSSTQSALQTAGVKEWNPQSGPAPSSSIPSSPAVAQNCPGNYCGNDPIVKARLGVQ
jgi:hypothetical protein